VPIGSTPSPPPKRTHDLNWREGGENGFHGARFAHLARLISSRLASPCLVSSRFACVRACVRACMHAYMGRAGDRGQAPGEVFRTGLGRVRLFEDASV
jgi:hypothetical protein